MFPHILAISSLEKGNLQLVQEPRIMKARKELGTSPIDLGHTGDIGLQILWIASQRLHHLGDDLGQSLGSLASFALGRSSLLMSLGFGDFGLLLLVGTGLLSCR